VAAASPTAPTAMAPRRLDTSRRRLMSPSSRMGALFCNLSGL
jgi:hypothetical protein